MATTRIFADMLNEKPIMNFKKPAPPKPKKSKWGAMAKKRGMSKETSSY